MPSFPGSEQSCNSHLAALVAINIVTQVLDEAEDILNAAHDSGQPWRNIWRQKKGNGEFYENAIIFDLQVDEIDTDDHDINQSDNVIITSTPQKEMDYMPRIYNENTIIGQGDEDIQMVNKQHTARNAELRSSSLLINCLFDISEVEQPKQIESFDDVQDDTDSREFIASTMAKIVESYVNLALDTVCGDIIIAEPKAEVESFEGGSNSSYSLLTDALVSDDIENENATYCVNNVKPDELKNECTTEQVKDEDMQAITKKDIDLYEKTFFTLNRDYDTYIEEDFVQEDNIFTMQEVELTTKKSSERIESFSEPAHELTNKEEIATAAEGGHKNSLVKRCRLQGAKLMSRLRSWWWKQRLIGRRKGGRSGICPLSPNARNRACSLLDHRKLRSPSPMRTTAWKFNTVNEALIHSYNMKDYDLKINSSDPLERD